MDQAPAYGAGDSGFESRYGLLFLFLHTKVVFDPACVDETRVQIKSMEDCAQLFSREQASKKLARIV